MAARPPEKCAAGGQADCFWLCNAAALAPTPADTPARLITPIAHPSLTLDLPDGCRGHVLPECLPPLLAVRGRLQDCRAAEQPPPVAARDPSIQRAFAVLVGHLVTRTWLIDHLPPLLLFRGLSSKAPRRDTHGAK